MISLYIGVGFFFRMKYESGLVGQYWVSLLTGGLSLLLLWALIKSGILNPQWFAFEKEWKSNNQDIPANGSS
ncbi:MAG: hypothetical protein AAGM67_02580 [Bacteroidota bacterium]